MNRYVLSLVLFFTLCWVHPASGLMVQTGPNTYMAGVPTLQFQQASQKSTNWCWAASIEMVLKYHGLNVTQESMVQKIHGSLVDKIGDPWQILRALTGSGPNAVGRMSQIYAEGYTGLYPYFIQDLINGYPLIVGLNYGTQIGHAVVLTAVTYSTDMFGRQYPLSVVIRDPWPSNPPRQEIPFPIFQRGCFFSARVATFPY